jgi:WD40 repeat protein
LSGLTAIRHSNNRDWWLLVPRINDNTFYRILVAPEGISLDGEQEIGKVHLYGEYSVRFSPDGTKYAYAAYCPADGPPTWPVLHPSELFDFDRSNGHLNDPIEFSFFDTNSWIHNIAFSPNSKLLYASLGKRIYQWDTDAQDMDSTMTIVGENDGYTWYGVPTFFSYCQLAPDNRIYLCSLGPFMHIIDKPDIPGVGCDVIQRNIHFPNDKPIMCIPNFPDFRLGSVTAVSEIANERSILIYPNPANDFLQIHFTEDFPVSNSLEIEIIDYLGRQIETLSEISSTNPCTISTSDYTPGLYFVKVQDEKRVLSCKKIIVSH